MKQNSHKRPAGSFARHLRGGAAAFALVLSGLAQPAGADTLEEALISAYESNPTLLAEQARLRATDEGVAQAISGWRPTVSLSGSYGLQDTTSKNGNNFGTSSSESTDPLTARATLSQPVYSGGRTEAQTRAARASVRQGRATLQSVEQGVLGDAVTAYFDVVRDLAVVRLRENNVAVLNRQLRAAQDRFQVGEITRTDVAQAEARLSRARSDLITAEANLIASSETYEQVVGKPPQDLDTDPPLPVLPGTEAEALEIAIGNDPRLRAAEEQERASFHTVRQVEGQLLPTVSLDGSLSHAEDSSIEGSQNTSASILGNVTVPLYQAGSVYSQIREAKELNSRDRIRIAEARRQTEADVATAWENLRSSQAVIVASEEQVRANQIAFEGVSQEARVGSRTTLDVLDAEQELLDSRVALVTAQRNEYVAAYNLLAVIGGLTAQNLGLPVRTYDPEVNFERVDNKFFGSQSFDEAVR